MPSINDLIAGLNSGLTVPIEGRNSLRTHFLTGEIPTQDHFHATLNSAPSLQDDGLFKDINNPLCIQATDQASNRHALHIYRDNTSEPAWRFRMEGNSLAGTSGWDLFIDGSSDGSAPPQVLGINRRLEAYADFYVEDNLIVSVDASIGENLTVGGLMSLNSSNKLAAAANLRVLNENDGFTVSANPGSTKGLEVGASANSGNVYGAVINAIGDAVSSPAQKLGLYVTASGNDPYDKRGVYARAIGNSGIKYGVYGLGSGDSGTKYGVYGQATGTAGNRYAVRGIAISGTSGDVFGAHGTAQGNEATTKYGLYGLGSGNTGTKYGVYGLGTGTDGAKYGLYGRAEGDNSSKYGVYGYANGTDSVKYGVYGYATGANSTKYGILGYANAIEGSKYGLYGRANGTNSTKYGVYGYGSGDAGTKYGVRARATGNGGTKYGIYANATGTGTNYAGYFSGNVHVQGTLSKSTGSFLIDHPLDPENKTLRHNFVESPENLCMYRGKVSLGSSGRKLVKLPAYFAALTKEAEATIILTPIGKESFGVSYEWKEDHTGFTVFGKANAEVSYLVMADRDDPAMHYYQRPVEEEKGGDNFRKGTYIHAEAYQAIEDASPPPAPKKGKGRSKTKTRSLKAKSGAAVEKYFLSRKFMPEGHEEEAEPVHEAPPEPPEMPEEPQIE